MSASVTLVEHLARIRELRRPQGREYFQNLAERKKAIGLVKRTRQVQIPDQMEFDLLEVAYILNCDKQTVRRWIKVGELKAEKRGRSWYVTRRELFRMIDNMERIRLEFLETLPPKKRQELEG